jgi:hypothetical protein
MLLELAALVQHYGSVGIDQCRCWQQQVNGLLIYFIRQTTATKGYNAAAAVVLCWHCHHRYKTTKPPACCCICLQCLGCSNNRQGINSLLLHLLLLQHQPSAQKQCVHCLLLTTAVY